MPDNDTKLSFHEEFARFLESPDRKSFRDLLEHRLGEYNFLDFKEEWPERSDLAKHALGFANTGSGCLVIGIAEDSQNSELQVRGLEKLTDKTKIKQGIQKYLPSSERYKIHEFEYKESEYDILKGKKFQVFLVGYNPASLPILSVSEGASLRLNRVYVRRNNATEEADHETLQEIFRKRIRVDEPDSLPGGFSEHLNQLAALYSHVEPYEWFSGRNLSMAGLPNFNDKLKQLIRRKEAIIDQLMKEPN